MKSLIIYIAALLAAFCAFSVFGTPGRDVSDDAVSALEHPADTSGSHDAADSILPVIAAAGTDSDSVLVIPAVKDPLLTKESRVKYVKTDLDAPVVFSSSDSMLIKIGRAHV